MREDKGKEKSRKKKKNTFLIMNLLPAKICKICKDPGFYIVEVKYACVCVYVHVHEYIIIYIISVC